MITFPIPSSTQLTADTEFWQENGYIYLLCYRWKKSRLKIVSTQHCTAGENFKPLSQTKMGLNAVSTTQEPRTSPSFSFFVCKMGMIMICFSWKCCENWLNYYVQKSIGQYLPLVKHSIIVHFEKVNEKLSLTKYSLIWGRPIPLCLEPVLWLQAPGSQGPTGREPLRSRKGPRTVYGIERKLHSPAVAAA